MEELKKKPLGAAVKKETAVHLPAGEAAGGKAREHLPCALLQAYMVPTVVPTFTCR